MNAARRPHVVGALFVVLAAEAVLVRLGRGTLAAPPLSPRDIDIWLRERDVAIAAFALVRLFALAAGGYLAVLLVATLVERRSRSGRVRALVERLTLPVLRNALTSAVGLGAVAGPPPSAPPPEPSEPAVIRDVTPPAPDPRGVAVIREVTAPPADSHAVAVIRALPDAASSAVGAVASTTAPATTAPPPSRSAPASPDPARQWEVRPGDSLWSIAREHLEDVLLRPVDERETARYWRLVVAANPSPNPDLLFAGEVVELPAVTP